MNIYEYISELNKDGGHFLCTGITGEALGSKAVIADGRICCLDDRDTKWMTDHIEALSGIEVSGIHEIDGSSIYAEALGSEKDIVICGAGHISMALIDMAKMIGFNITVIDDRLSFADNAIRRGADTVICKSFEEALDSVEGSADTFFVVVTRGHRYDRECLRKITQKPNAYIGMLGSKRRTILVKRELEEEGISREVLDAIYTPIGLSIGAETPEEIAVAIMAEIIENKNRRKSYGFSRELISKLCETDREEMVLATIIERAGSAPRGMGTKMLIMRDGSIAGTIGGGCIEGSVIQKGRRMLITGDKGPAIVNVDLSNETAEDEGMVCGGTVEVMLEAV